MPDSNFECWACGKSVAEGSVRCGHCEAHQLIAGRYKPVEKLGAGQFGIVYKAYRADIFGEGPPDNSEDFYAIKVFKNPTDDEELVRRELKLLYHLPGDNPNLVRVTEDTCREYVVMEFVDGRDLHSLVRAAGDASDPSAQATATSTLESIRTNFDDFLMGLCTGLTGIHTSGMIHRDLKPKNILVTKHGAIPKIVDMGLGKMVAGSPAQSRVGSLEIMAPEVLNTPPGSSYDNRVDIWALGVVIFFLWSGVYPFGNQIASSGEKDPDWVDYNTLIAKIRTESPTPIVKLNPAVPTTVINLIDELLVKDPRIRLASAQAVEGRLGALPYEKMKDPQSYTIPEYQRQLSKLYARRNAPLPAADFLGHALGHVSYVYNANKAFTADASKKAALEDACKEHLPRVFSWLCGLVEAAGWSIVDVVPYKYDGQCPYCESAECTMQHPVANEKINRLLLERLREERKVDGTSDQGASKAAHNDYEAWTFGDFASMFKQIYGKHNEQLELREILDHFHSEADEFFEAMYDATERRDPDATAIMYLELADLFAWFFAVCEAVPGEKSWFEKAFWDTYKECPRDCGTVPCSCPPVAGELALRNWRLSETTLREADFVAPVKAGEAS